MCCGKCILVKYTLIGEEHIWWEVHSCGGGGGGGGEVDTLVKCTHVGEVHPCCVKCTPLKSTYMLGKSTFGGKCTLC